MVRNLIFVLSVLLNLNASVYQKNCVACHKNSPVKMDKFFYLYLLKYSSAIETKYAMKLYLQNPKKENSVLSPELLKRFKIKKKTTLSKKELEKAIDEYWEIYKIFGKLK